MGSRGPVPKREDQRVRRNKDDAGPVDKIHVSGEVEVPELDIPGVHPMVQDFYDSLPVSAQTRYYEPSDWQLARIVCWHLDQQFKNAKGPSAMMLSTLSSMFNDLMVDEATRRRLRLEVERNQAGAPGGDVLDVAAVFRQRQQSA